MYFILGANGHVGSVLARTLLGQQQPVTVMLHQPEHAAQWQQQGAQVAVADVHDVAALHQVFSPGGRLFLLNPPAAPATDTATEERRTLAAILAAIEDAGLARIVAESTYGAQPGERAGDLGVLYEMEQALAAQPVPASIIRAAYYMSNWDAALPAAKEQGQVPTLYPLDFQLPMVAPADIAQLAARLLTASTLQPGPQYMEGPSTYSPADVAQAFAAALRRPVIARETPRPQWLAALRTMGFSEPAADSFARMTALTLDGQGPRPEHPVRGTTTLWHYIEALVKRPSSQFG